MKNTRAGDRSMMLRLVLVGMVAALGVTIPGGTNRGGWLVSVERWSNSVLMDWDTWTPDNRASPATASHYGSARMRAMQAGDELLRLRSASKGGSFSGCRLDQVHAWSKPGWL